MKSLNEYIMENKSNIGDLYSSIINSLNNMMKNNNKEDIQRIYNICNTIKIY